MFFLKFIKFIRLTMANKIIWISSVQFSNTSSVYCMWVSFRSPGPSFTTYLTPYTFSDPPHCPFPLVTTTLQSVYELLSVLSVFFSFLHCYIPPMSEIICLWTFSVLFLLAWYSQDPSLLLQMTVFDLSHGWGVFPCIYGPHLLYPIIYQNTLCLFSCLGHHE